jgi:hypothetical protein
VEIGQVLDNINLEQVNGVPESCSDTDEDNLEETHDFEFSRRLHEDSSELVQLYNAALILRHCIEDVPSFPDMWPPTARNISNKDAEKIVPTLLYNFLAWLLNKSEEPIDEEFVKIEEHEEKKVLSIAQDMVYVWHNGKKQTPKSISLSMAVRQISGCSKIIDILNGFGHCVSHSSMLRHETALAKMNIQKEVSIPREILPGHHTILVWDNDDFAEETKISTHITNGIAIQEEKKKTSLPTLK